MGSKGSRCKNQSMRVRFSPYAKQITLPNLAAPAEDDDDPSVDSSSSSSSDTSNSHYSNLWYSKEEMTNLARADVNALVAQSKVASKCAGDVPQQQQQQQPPVCPRGLEMYMPGQLVIRQRRRKAYQQAALRKRELLLTLYSNNPGEVATRLEKFLASRSQESKDESLALGVQDAMDAQAVYQESNNILQHPPRAPSLLAEHLANSSSSMAISSSSPLAKQVLTTMRNHPAMLRVT